MNAATTDTNTEAELLAHTRPGLHNWDGPRFPPACFPADPAARLRMPRPSRACNDFRRAATLTRRAALKVGAVSLAGLTLPGVLKAEKAAGTPRKATAKSVILLFQFGGPS